MDPIGCSIYLITDDGSDQPARLQAALEALPRGIAAVQLRAKTASGRELYDRARSLRELTRRFSVQLFINDRVDVALAVGAEGIHVPTSGLPLAVVRALAPDLVIAASTHSLVEAQAAVAGGAQFVTFGPVWPTKSHPDTAPVGLAALREVVRSLGVPVFALGGVDAQRAREAATVGARIACLGTVLGATDPAQAARAMIASIGLS